MTMRTISLGSLGVTLVLFSALTARLGAQQVAPADCGKAANIVSRGRTTPTDDWAFSALSACGPAGARAVAAGMAFYRTETNVVALEDYMTQVDNWRDDVVLSAVLELATDDAATVQARVFAVRHLMLLLEPNLLLTYDGLIRKADTTVTRDMVTWQAAGCTAQMVSAPHGSFKGAPLAPDYKERISETFRSLLNSSTTPAPVRNAANCAKYLTTRLPAGTR
jgi:hypothetical protein